MDQNYLDRLTNHPVYRDFQTKLAGTMSGDPVKTAFCSGFGSGFLIGCCLGFRNLTLLVLGGAATYYCYTSYAL
jgi:hypothetical protein